MPNNRPLAVARLMALLKLLEKDPLMKTDYFAFMGKIFNKNHADPVPPDEIITLPGLVNFLSHFGVYHNKNIRKLRAVFDAAIAYLGTCLNRELLTGPDLVNRLIGVMLRFREDIIAFMADIEAMFHGFYVDPADRDFLRFLWHENNDPNAPIIEYRMNVHVQGSVSSPAIATHGLRRIAVEQEEMYGTDVKDFINKNFYVDDGLKSMPTVASAISLLDRARKALATANLRLHKIVSNNPDVMSAFPEEERADNVQSLDFDTDTLPTQRSLGVYWKLDDDAFILKVDENVGKKATTQRGILSAVHSINDVFGVAAPFVVGGKLILQEIMRSKQGWDTEINPKLKARWDTWKSDLPNLEKIILPRCYHPVGFGKIVKAELHAFSDASSFAISEVTYLRLVDEHGQISVSFVMGKSKVLSAKQTTIPRLELIAALLAVLMTCMIQKELTLNITKTKFYTDSKIALGYISNDSRRFRVFVANRVQKIRERTSIDQWHFVKTCTNPADIGTRPCTVQEILDSSWLHGPAFLYNKEDDESTPGTLEAKTDPTDPEIRKEYKVDCKKTIAEAQTNTDKTKTDKPLPLGTERFTRFSKWSRLCSAICVLKRRIRAYKATTASQTKLNVHTVTNHDADSTPIRSNPEELYNASMVMIRAAQEELFPGYLRDSNLVPLDPYIDENRMLRVGGRLQRSDFDPNTKNPLLLPQKCSISDLITRHYHEQIHHQGRNTTHAAIRNAGFWIVHGRAVVDRIIRNCVTCKKLRAKPNQQKMADLPKVRLESVPPFTYVGLDVFGPFEVVARRTRGGLANAKRWVVIYVCLSMSAIHLEVIESMDTSSFICALRRFISIRGQVKEIRCDCGSNHVGAKNELKNAADDLDHEAISKFTSSKDCEWLNGPEWNFNPPKASHFGGIWERQIGTVRRVLEGMFVDFGRSQLTHEILVTFIAEAAAIVNNRPLTAISSDANDPEPLCANNVLTMKSGRAPAAPGVFLPEDQYTRRRWRRAQYMTDQFYIRYKKEITLQTRQTRQMWRQETPNLQENDVVLLKDESLHRNNWPLGRVTKIIKSQDSLVRKVEITIVTDGKKKTFLRPVDQTVYICR